jgi:hypothetical protein
VTEVSTDTSYADGDGTSWDTDGDYLRDGGECDFFLEPNSTTFEQGQNERRLCMRLWGAPDADTDLDGLPNAVEICKWMTSPDDPDSDGDGLSDCEEAADIDGNGYVTTGDGILILRAALGISAQELATMDINASYSITITDGLFAPRAYYGLNTCLIYPKTSSSYFDPTGPRLEFDHNPANDGRPCDSIDASQTVGASTSFEVAVCLTNAAAPTLNGMLHALQAEIAYDSAQLSAGDISDDHLTDLDANPDWNESAFAAGTRWDCNYFDSTTSAPRASSPPISIACQHVTREDTPLSGTTVHLFTIALTALVAGTPELTWITGYTELLSGDLILACGINLTCIDAHASASGPQPTLPSVGAGTGTPHGETAWLVLACVASTSLLCLALARTRIAKAQQSHR